jgi:hypothetical protein
MSIRNFTSKSEYKKYHAKVLNYISEEYSDYKFKTTSTGSLLIQLSEIDKHTFHLVVGTMSDPKHSIGYAATNVVAAMSEILFHEQKFDQPYHQKIKVEEDDEDEDWEDYK